MHLILATFAMRLIVLLFIAMPLLHGCGKKGNLYLPDPGKPTPSQQSAK